jgi:hypothetical protein
VWGKVAVAGIVVSAAGVDWLYTWSSCGWPVWGKVPVPGIYVSAGGGVVVYMELLWLACVG